MATTYGPTIPIDLTRLQWVPTATVPPAQRAEAAAFTDRVCDAIMDRRRNDPHDHLFKQTGRPTRPDPIQPLADALRRERPALTTEQAYVQAFETAPLAVQALAIETQVFTQPPTSDVVTDPRMAEIDAIVDIKLRQRPELTREQATAELLEVRPELYARYMASR